MSDASLKAAFKGGKAFIPFITCGDPDLETTERLIHGLVDAGADIIELGIPFSDPTAEGPVIQEANLRALEGGVTTDAAFELVRAVRGDAVHPVTVPIVFMTYANVVFHYSTNRFCARAAEVGVDGLILPDVPFEEKGEFQGECNSCGLALISMIAPTSEARIQRIAREAEGFVYCVSSLGVSGIRKEITTDIGAMVSQVRAVTDTPTAIGFGISTPEQAAAMAAKADGAIVGSALVKIVAEQGREAPAAVIEFARMLAEAVHSAA